MKCLTNFEVMMNQLVSECATMYPISWTTVCVSVCVCEGVCLFYGRQQSLTMTNGENICI